jgi:hypothetical protein
MHSLYFVRIEKARDAEEAKRKADAVLEENSFAGDGGYYCVPKADWYVIGGGWSGFLTDITPEGKRAEADIRAMLKADYPGLELGLRGVRYGDAEKEKLRLEASRRADALYTEATGFPYIRDSYEVDGHTDDARQITLELLAALRAEAADTEVCLVGEHGGIEDENRLYDLGDEALLGSWLVVVDYHS